MWQKTITFTITFLFLISSSLAYQYVATKGNRQIWADDLEAHNTITTLPFKFCNLNPVNKTFKPTAFLDMEGKKAYYYTNITHYGWNYTSVLRNVTKWHTLGGINTSYQETVLKTEANWAGYVYPDWQEISTTKTKGGKKEVTSQSITFTKGECKDFKFVYENTLQPIGEPAIKYDLGENKGTILDPLINATDYGFNATLDSNSSVTTSTIQSDTNVSNSGNATYANTSDLWGQWQLDEAAGTVFAKDDLGLRNLSVMNPVNWSFGVGGSIGTAGTPNGTGTNGTGGSGQTGNIGQNGYLCMQTSPNPPPNLTTLDFYMTVWSRAIVGSGANNVNATWIADAVTIELQINASGYIRMRIPATNDSMDGLGANILYSNAPITLGTKYLLGATYNGTKGRLFLDNVDVSVYNETSTPFALNNATNGFSFGGEPNNCGQITSLACVSSDGTGNTASICSNITFDQIRWRNTSITSFPSTTTRYASNWASTTNNITRFRPTILGGTNLAATNISVSLGGAPPYVQNISNNTVYNWTQNVRNIFRYSTDFTAAADFYGANYTFGSPTVNESILTSKNTTHNNTLNITIQCSDGLPNPTFYYYDNTSLFNINTNTGSINYDPLQNQTGSYQIGITCDQNSYNITRPFNLTVFNSAINVTSATINPINPSSTDSLSCTWTGTDAEADTDAGSTYRWYINNATIASTAQTITTGYSTGDYANCEVLAFDGNLNSTNRANSSGIIIQSGGGGGGGSGQSNKPTIIEEALENETTPPPEIQPLFTPTPITPLEEIYRDIPPPEICGDKICSQSESYSTCAADCQLDLDVIAYEFVQLFPPKLGRIKCLFTPGSTCSANTNAVLAFMIGLFLLLIFLLFLFGGKKDDDKKKRRKY